MERSLYSNVARGGEVLEGVAGVKDVVVRAGVAGGVAVHEVDEPLARRLCLDEPHLRRLHDLALRCEEAFGPRRDVAWAFAQDELFLLRCRGATRVGLSTL